MKSMILATVCLAFSVPALADETAYCDNPDAAISKLKELGVEENDIAVIRNDAAKRLMKGINETGAPTDYTAESLVVVHVDADRVAIILFDPCAGKIVKMNSKYFLEAIAKSEGEKP